MRIEYILTVILLLIFPLRVYGDKAANLNKKGIKAYRENRLDESIKDFTDALIERPDSPELSFNRGTALSSAGKKDDAIEELGKAAQSFKNPANEAAAQFNMGNTLANAKDIPSAIEQFKNSIKLDQTAKDYRHNLELLMKEKRKNEQQQQKSKDDKNQKDNKDNKKSDSKDQNNNNQEQNKPEQSNSQNRQEMSAQEAKQLLDAIEDGEKKAFELRRKEIQNNMENKNDW